MAVAELAVDAQLILDGKDFLPNSGVYLASKAFADQQSDIIRVILEEVQKVNEQAARNPAAIAAILSSVYGVDKAALELTEKRRGHGIKVISDEAIAAQQTMADTFFREKLLPKQVTVKDAVWTSNGKQILEK